MRIGTLTTTFDELNFEAMHLTSNDLIHKFKMQKLEPEGGFFSRQSESLLRVEVPFGPNGEIVNRSLMTSIYYLVTNESFSAFHKLKGCETYHFYSGRSARTHVDLSRRTN